MAATSWCFWSVCEKDFDKVLIDFYIYTETITFIRFRFVSDTWSWQGCSQTWLIMVNRNTATWNLFVKCTTRLCCITILYNVSWCNLIAISLHILYFTITLLFIILATSIWLIFTCFFLSCYYICYEFYIWAPGSDTEGNLFPGMTLINWLTDWCQYMSKNIQWSQHKHCSARREDWV